MTAASPKTLGQLRRFLNLWAPSLSASQLRQSRRLEGQFTMGGDIQAYSEVLVAAGPGCHSFTQELRVIAKAITAHQMDVRRGRYEVRLRPFDAAVETVSKKLNDTSSPTKLRSFVLEHLGTETQPGHLDTLPKAHGAGLILLVSAKGTDSISRDIKDQLAGHPKRQVIWIILEQDAFTWGTDCPLLVK